VSERKKRGIVIEIKSFVQPFVSLFVRRAVSDKSGDPGRISEQYLSRNQYRNSENIEKEE
jgi:hypothetical protein